MSLPRKALHRLSRYVPRFFWSQYAQKTRRAGLKRLYFILSFDCDTPEDAAAAEQLTPWLCERGVKMTYAVPGAQLEQHATIYRRIAEGGADFINHGGLPHTEWRDGRYWSVTFYHKMSPEEVVEDIQRGHRIVERVIGRPPKGFRAPHFGYFQQRKQLGLLYKTLRELEYTYSTSTMPAVGFRHGPVLDVDGIYEVPLSGSFASPLNVFDSWGHIISPFQPTITEAYVTEAIDTIDYLTAAGINGVLNYYVDPAHVWPSDHFKHLIEHIIACGIQTLFYEELLALAG